jgi:hypothetical protein
MAFIHVLECRIQPAFHSDVQTIDSGISQSPQFRIRFMFDVLDGRIHGDGLYLRQPPVDSVGNLHQTISRKNESVSMLKKYPLDIRAITRSLNDIRLYLFYRSNREFDVRIHVAKGAFVMAASKRHLQKKRVCLIWRPVHNACHVHLSSPPFI